MIKQSRIDWFDDLKKAQINAVSTEYDVLVELRIDQSTFDLLKAATIHYIRACLEQPVGIDSEESLMAYIETHVDELANRTPNGILMPKHEFEEEFNRLHRALASYVRTLDIDDSIYGVQTPIIVRMVKGNIESDTDVRPYATTQIHLDPWAGDPGDGVTISIPIMGDIHRTGVDYFQSANEIGSDLIRPMDTFKEGQDLLGEREQLPLEQRFGYAYFMDSVVPHRTVKQGGQIRVTLEFRIRRRTTEEEKAAVEGVCDTGRLSHYVEVAEWHKLGSTKRMKFLDTNADAKQGIFLKRPYNEPVYTTVDISPANFD